MNPTDYAYCRKCIYLSGSDHPRTCDYFLITGHLRGCPGGVGCTKRVNGKKAKQKMPRLFPNNPEPR